jgi:pheromone shutdown protein TraB
MKLQVYQVLHVLSVILLFAVTFSGFASPSPDRRRRVLMGSGIIALVTLVTGFGLISAVYKNEFQIWMFVKMGVWLTVAVLGSAAFRQPAKAGLFAWLTALLAAVAVSMVYLKPFSM